MMVLSIIPYQYQSFPTSFLYLYLEILQVFDSIDGIHFIIKIICHQFLFRPYHGYVCREFPSTTVMFYLLLLTFKTQALPNTWLLCFIFKCYYNSLFFKAVATCL